MNPASSEAAEIHAARGLQSTGVHAVPLKGMHARAHGAVHERADSLAKRVVDDNLRPGIIFEGKTDRCAGIERIGEVVIQGCFRWLIRIYLN